MSKVLGVNATLAATPTPANRLKPGQHDGRIKSFQDTYEASTLVAGSTIKMGPKLPKGAIVLNVEIMADALGAGNTIIVGDAEDDNRYILSEEMDTAQKILRTNAVGGKNYEVDKSDADNLDNQITITTGGVSISGTIKLTCFYTHD